MMALDALLNYKLDVKGDFQPKNPLLGNYLNVSLHQVQNVCYPYINPKMNYKTLI